MTSRNKQFIFTLRMTQISLQKKELLKEVIEQSWF